MRTFKIVTACTLFATVTLLAFGVLDFCRVGDDGKVSWAPSLRTTALRRYGVALWQAAGDALSPAPDPKTTADARTASIVPARR